jgi:predicted nucleic acid-binding protein
MIVVSDTTPLNYLILIGAAHVLPELFGRVYAPTAVIKELSHARSPKRACPGISSGSSVSKPQLFAYSSVCSGV